MFSNLTWNDVYGCQFKHIHIINGVTIYDCDEYPIQIGLIHQKNDVQSEYNKNGTILSALESYQCVINFI